MLPSLKKLTKFYYFRDLLPYQLDPFINQNFKKPIIEDIMNNIHEQFKNHVLQYRGNKIKLPVKYFLFFSN